MPAERLVVDGVERLGELGAAGADEVGPSAAILEAGVGDARELIGPAGGTGSRLPLRRINHAARPKAADANAVELVEKATMIGIVAALAHDDGSWRECSAKRKSGLNMVQLKES